MPLTRMNAAYPTSEVTASGGRKTAYRPATESVSPMEMAISAVAPCLEAALTSTFMVRPSLIARYDRTRRARGSRVHDHVHRAQCCASCTALCIVHRPVQRTVRGAPTHRRGGDPAWRRAERPEEGRRSGRPNRHPGRRERDALRRRRGPWRRFRSRGPTAPGAQDLVEDDRGEGRGADPAHLEVTDLHREVARTHGQRRADRDEVAAAAEVDLVLAPDPGAGRGNEAEQDDRETTQDGPRDRPDEGPELRGLSLIHI